MTIEQVKTLVSVSTHSRPKAAGAADCAVSNHCLFQHTAARRRLAKITTLLTKNLMVSTHSRPKAAGRLPHLLTPCPGGFNTQPPEGGWLL